MIGDYRAANTNEEAPSGGAMVALRAALREGGRPLVALLVVAVLSRVAFLWEFLAINPLATQLYSDAKLYHEWAITIANGDLLGPAEPFHHPPAYPYLVGLVYAIVGPSPAAVFVLQSLLGPIVLLAFYALARRVAPRPFALFAVLCATLYLPMPLFETRLLGESAATAACAFALLHLTSFAGRGTRGRLLIGGLLLGLACALRPNQLLALAFIGVAAVWMRGDGRSWPSRFFDGAAVLLGGLLAIAPFTARNLVHAEEFVLLCDSGGVNLYLAHHAHAGASFRVPDPAWGNVEEQARVARAHAVALTSDRDLTWREVSSVLARRAIDFALENPAIELRLLGERLRAFLDDFEYEVLYSPVAERAIQRTSNLFFLSFVPIAMFATAGIWFALRVRDRRRDAATVVLLAFALAQLVTVLLFFQYARFRLVALPALVPLAALGAAEVWACLVRAKRIEFGVFVAIGAGIVSGLDETTEAKEQVANQHVTIAGAFRAVGRLPEARAALARAEEILPGHPRQFLERAQIAMAAKDLDGARSALENGLVEVGDDPVLLSELARRLVLDGTDIDRARALAERAVRSAPGFLLAHETLGLALIRSGDDSALLTAMRRATSLAEPSATLYAMLARALRITGDREGAAQAIEQALRRDPQHKQALGERAELAR